MNTAGKMISTKIKSYGIWLLVYDVHYVQTNTVFKRIFFNEKKIVPSLKGDGLPQNVKCRMNGKMRVVFNFNTFHFKKLLQKNWNTSLARQGSENG